MSKKKKPYLPQGIEEPFAIDQRGLYDYSNALLIPKFLGEIPGINVSVMFLYAEILRHCAYAKTTSIEISVAELAKELGVSERTISHCNDLATKAGLLVIKPTGRSNRYTLCHHPAMGRSLDELTNELFEVAARSKKYPEKKGFIYNQ